MQIFTAAVHAIGEDNEGNVAFAARTEEALRAKILAWHNSVWADEPDSDCRFATYEDLVASEEYAISWNEDILED